MGGDFGVKFWTFVVRGWGGTKIKQVQAREEGGGGEGEGANFCHFNNVIIEYFNI